MRYIHQAGNNIEQAREQGGAALEEIVAMLRKHIPAHSQQAIIARLSPEMRVINYQHLNVDEADLQQIMDLSIEAGILKAPIDINSFADKRFSIAETEISVNQSDTHSIDE